MGQGRQVPVIAEGPDSVTVTIQRRILRPELIGFMERATQAYQLTQKEKITLGILALSDGLTTQELSTRLEVEGAEALKPWMGRLDGLNLVATTGRTKAKRYFVLPDVLKSLEIQAPTTLTRIEPHRLQELLLEDLRRYPGSPIGDIRLRIGAEIPPSQVKRALEALVRQGKILASGENKGRRYSICP